MIRGVNLKKFFTDIWHLSKYLLGIRKRIFYNFLSLFYQQSIKPLLFIILTFFWLMYFLHDQNFMSHFSRLFFRTLLHGQKMNGWKIKLWWTAAIHDRKLIGRSDHHLQRMKIGKIKVYSFFWTNLTDAIGDSEIFVIAMNNKNFINLFKFM